MLQYLIFLACPIGMGLMMMLMMMRDRRGAEAPTSPASQDTGAAGDTSELRGLHTQLELLESHQAVLRAEVRRLSARGAQVPPVDGQSDGRSAPMLSGRSPEEPSRD